jgi:hypothetical protein
MLRASLHPKKIGLLYLALTLESWGKGLKGLEMEMCIPSMAPCTEGNLRWILSFTVTFCSLLLFSQRDQPLVNLVDNITDFVENEKHCGSALSKKLRANEKVHCLHWLKSCECHPDLYENKVSWPCGLFWYQSSLNWLAIWGNMTPSWSFKGISEQGKNSNDSNNLWDVTRFVQQR